MSPQDQLQARYLQSLQYQVPPPTAVHDHYEEERSTNPFFVCLMWLLVGIGLMFVAFQLGILDRYFGDWKQKDTPKAEPNTVPKPLYYEVVEEEEDYLIDLSGMPSLEESQETDVDRRFSSVAEKYGLLDKAQQNGHSFGMNPANKDPEDGVNQ